MEPESKPDGRLWRALSAEAGDGDWAERAHAAATRAAALAATATPVEQALTAAIGTRYTWPAPAERAALDRAYADAMRTVHHAHGALLLEAGRVAEAEAAYREDLRRLPENGWTLHGLAECCRRLGRTREATLERRFAKAWQHATMAIHASSLCRPPVAEAPPPPQQTMASGS